MENSFKLFEEQYQPNDKSQLNLNEGKMNMGNNQVEGEINMQNNEIGGQINMLNNSFQQMNLLNQTGIQMNMQNNQIKQMSQMNQNNPINMNNIEIGKNNPMGQQTNLIQNSQISPMIK